MWELGLILPFGLLLLIGLGIFLLEVKNWKLRFQSQLPSDLPTCYRETRRKWLDSKATSKINRSSGHSSLFEDHLSLISKQSAFIIQRDINLHRLQPHAEILSNQRLGNCSLNKPPVTELQNFKPSKQTQTALVDVQCKSLPEKIKTSIF